MRVLMSGASGLLGSAIARALEANRVLVGRLVRGGAPSSAAHIRWDPGKALDLIPGFDGVIHLAGESVVGRWTAAKKARIRDSRVLGTRTLAEAIARVEPKPRVFLAASAIGYYGDRGDEILREESASGTGFLAEVCREWEDAAEPAMQAGIRVVHLRIGVVLSKQGGALDKMLLPFRLGLGGKLGSGRQWMSWIHVDDIVSAVQHALSNEAVRGPVNLVAPNPVTNAEFTATLGKALSRPAVLPAPAFALRLALGEMADGALLASARVEPARLLASGYVFRFRELQTALENILRKRTWRTA
jgi:uncharacterized protein (TIGR01777 family)